MQMARGRNLEVEEDAVDILYICCFVMGFFVSCHQIIINEFYNLIFRLACSDLYY